MNLKQKIFVNQICIQKNLSQEFLVFLTGLGPELNLECPKLKHTVMLTNIMLHPRSGSILMGHQTGNQASNNIKYKQIKFSNKNLAS